jgi:hypothetical protein
VFGQIRKTKRRPRPADPAGRKVRGIRPRVRYEPSLNAWICPMPTIDPQIVLRSARSLAAYGPDFQYGHYVQVRRAVNLAALVGGVGGLIALSQIGPARELLRKVRPSGEGPSAEERSRSWFEVTFHGTTSSQRIVTRVSGGDPGYDETAKMVSESALCLALDRDKLPPRSGVLTPAEAMGETLIERLKQKNPPSSYDAQTHRFHRQGVVCVEISQLVLGAPGRLYVLHDRGSLGGRAERQRPLVPQVDQIHERGELMGDHLEVLPDGRLVLGALVRDREPLPDRPTHPLRGRLLGHLQ